MVIGSAGELPKPPSTPVQFLEGKPKRVFTLIYLSYFVLIDMNESELASAVSTDIRRKDLCLNLRS
jgi:adenylate kinase